MTLASIVFSNVFQSLHDGVNEPFGGIYFLFVVKQLRVYLFLYDP
jgi:hypothetical protein